MANNQMAEAFAPAEAHYKSKVLEMTWGHIAPKKNKKYTGFITFARGCYSGTEAPIQMEFNELDDSPWLYDHACEAIYKWSQEYPYGSILKWEGEFRNYVFKGEVSVISTTF